MQGNNGLWPKTFEKSYFNSLSKVTHPPSNFWILPSGKLAVRAVGVWMNNSRKRPQNHFRLHFTSRTPYEFDTGGILSTPACDVLVRLKRTGKAISTIRKSLDKQSRQQFSFTKTSNESEVSQKILSHEQNFADLSLSFNPASPCLLFFKMNRRQEYRSKLPLYNR